MNANTRIDGSTPCDLTITPRDRRFGRDEQSPRWWHGGNPYASALYNALSATFPLGEAFFVESVRKFRDSAPEPLASEIRAFTTQEVIHSREHLAFNRRAADAGYDLRPLETQVANRLALTRDRPEIVSLAATMALELLRQDDITGVRAWARLLWFMWIRPGMMRKVFAAWAAFFRPGFHPWTIDDRALITDYEAASGAGFDSAKKVRRAA